MSSSELFVRLNRVPSTPRDRFWFRVGWKWATSVGLENGWLKRGEAAQLEGHGDRLADEAEQREVELRAASHGTQSAERERWKFIERRELVLTPASRLQYVTVPGVDRWLLAVDGVTIAYVDPLAGYGPELLPDSAQFDRREGEAK